MDSEAYVYLIRWSGIAERYFEKSLEKLYLALLETEIQKMKGVISERNVRVEDMCQETMQVLAGHVLVRHGVEAFRSLIVLYPCPVCRLLELSIDPDGPKLNFSPPKDEEAMDEYFGFGQIRH